MKIAKKVLLIVSRAFLLLFTLIYGVVSFGGSLANRYNDIVTNFLKQNASNVVKLEDEEDMEDIDAEYFKSGFASVAEVRKSGIDWTQTIMEEGAVLLKNDNNALPLAKGSKVNIYGAGGARPVVGFNSYNKEHVDFDKGLSDEGFVVNQTLFDWYKNSGYGDAGSGRNYASRAINEAPWSVTPDAKNDEAEAAIYVISRNGGEGRDLRVRNLGEQIDGDETNGNYLMLSPTELNILEELQKLKTAGTIKKILVILNTTNHIAFEWADNYGVDAILYSGSVGSAGVTGLANIISGDVNPSGKLSDTLWKNHYLNPVLANFGQVSYDGSKASAYQYMPYTFSNTNDGYVVYQEGIYSGYRYTETRYEDVVMNAANVGEYDYNATVAYPFGYGLSYSNYEYTDMTVNYNEETDAYDVSVTVTNKGPYDGKHSVQLFLQKPYTAYDKQKGIEKASAELVAFAKTDVLSKNNGSETVTMSVARRDFASYDSYGEKTYILEAGDYYLALGGDVHEAVNNILAVKKAANMPVTVSAMKDEKGNLTSGNTAVVEKITLDNSNYKTYSTSVTGKEITNQFDETDLKLYEGAGEANKNAFEYVTRSNWQGTVVYSYTPEGVYTDKHVLLTKTAQMAADMENSATAEHSTEGTMPTMGSTATAWQLIDMLYDDNGDPLPYDAHKWEELLDQLTFNEMADLLSAAGYQTRPMNSISKPSTCDEDYDCGCIKPYDTHKNGLATRFDDPDKALEPAENCDNGIAASTRNLPLLYEYGVQWGEDCLWAGLTCLYGAGANMHRIAYGGRCRGYFSEDPILSGECVAQINLGMETKGIKMLLKHCFLNEQETGRGWLSTFANEQSVREIYLRPFQIGIEKGKVQGVMTAMNRIGVVGSMHHPFLNDVLRGEFGMCGYVVTDSYGGGMYLDQMFLAGNDLPLGVGSVDASWANYPNIVNAMRVSCHNVLYTVVHSNAMNGITANSKIITFQPEWQYYLERGTTAALVVMIFSVVFWAGMEVWSYFGNKKKEEN